MVIFCILKHTFSRNREVYLFFYQKKYNILAFLFLDCIYCIYYCNIEGVVTY
ncbi:hypothetical protein PEDI_53330 [Persicobacter diffluens]|uniref:Uncharacterized protein n=1 Tax=Persicobacter diffluens TaxID=981 RepID=A0AAN4W3L0_9BACT|nr:hypothetical protein PEDI_52250 [Persicobacter diffluens]GJM64781.1 hypothetical protein PEDI_53330 [Persicobacter diffluens]